MATGARIQYGVNILEWRESQAVAIPAAIVASLKLPKRR